MKIKAKISLFIACFFNFTILFPSENESKQMKISTDIGSPNPSEPSPYLRPLDLSKVKSSPTTMTSTPVAPSPYSARQYDKPNDLINDPNTINFGSVKIWQSPNDGTIIIYKNENFFITFSTVQSGSKYFDCLINAPVGFYTKSSSSSSSFKSPSLTYHNSDSFFLIDSWNKSVIETEGNNLSQTNIYLVETLKGDIISVSENGQLGFWVKPLKDFPYTYINKIQSKEYKNNLCGLYLPNESYNPTLISTSFDGRIRMWYKSDSNKWQCYKTENSKLKTIEGTDMNSNGTILYVNVKNSKVISFKTKELITLSDESFCAIL